MIKKSNKWPVSTFLCKTSNFLGTNSDRFYPSFRFGLGFLYCHVTSVTAGAEEQLSASGKRQEWKFLTDTKTRTNGMKSS